MRTARQSAACGPGKKVHGSGSSLGGFSGNQLWPVVLPVGEHVFAGNVAIGECLNGSTMGHGDWLCTAAHFVDEWLTQAKVLGEQRCSPSFFIEPFVECFHAT